MDVQTISALISSIGFPIVACCALGYYITKEMAGMQDDLKELTITIKELNVKLSNGKGGDIVNEVLSCESDKSDGRQ